LAEEDIARPEGTTNSRLAGNTGNESEIPGAKLGRNGHARNNSTTFVVFGNFSTHIGFTVVRKFVDEDQQWVRESNY